jgi:hypothetical protein
VEGTGHERRTDFRQGAGPPFTTTLDGWTMRVFLSVTVAIFITIIGPLPLKANESRSCGDLSNAIGHLGIPWEAAHEEVIVELHECGLAAAWLLLAELQVIDPESVDDPKWGHMVWCERALRSITGQYFRFKSAESLGRLSEFRGKDDHIGYVTEWMSRGRVYVRSARRSHPLSLIR